MIAHSRAGDNGVGWVVAGVTLAAVRCRPALAVRTAAVVWGTLGANYAVKLAVRRERPDGEVDEPEPLIDAPSSTSFPSSHAAMSAAAAVLLARAFPTAAPAIVLAAGAMAGSRLYLAVHHPSDVAAGVARGIATGLALAAATGG